METCGVYLQWLSNIHWFDFGVTPPTTRRSSCFVGHSYQPSLSTWSVGYYHGYHGDGRSESYFCVTRTLSWCVAPHVSWEVCFRRAATVKAALGTASASYWAIAAGQVSGGRALRAKWSKWFLVHFCDLLYTQYFILILQWLTFFEMLSFFVWQAKVDAQKARDEAEEFRKEAEALKKKAGKAW